MTTFKNPHDPENIVIISKVKEWVREKWSLPTDVLIQVLELNCMDPGCMDKETRIVLTQVDQPSVQYRVHKPLVYVRKHDIDQLKKSI